MLKYFSMFSGIGGFELGIKRCIKWQCIGFSEIDKYAIQIYQKHFPTHKNYRDATKLIPEELPDFDFLIGGFPCQSFTIAGRRKGFEDTRGTLFFDICRILRAKRPGYLLLENVKGLLSHDNGKTFEVILESLDELGYDLQWQVLNSKNFGVPQNRERVFIVGHLRGQPRPQVFPITKDDGLPNGKNDAEYSGTLKGSNMKADHTFIAERTPLKFLERNQRNIEGDYAFTVDSVNTGGVRLGTKIRRLTPTECERLQGFPDGWTEGISDTQRYKCLGNAVTVNVIEFIMQKLIGEILL